MTGLSQVQLLDMAREVLIVCSHCSLQDIITDLTMSKSAEVTINRILDGQVTIYSQERLLLSHWTIDPQDKADCFCYLRALLFLLTFLLLYL